MIIDKASTIERADLNACNEAYLIERLAFARPFQTVTKYPE